VEVVDDDSQAEDGVKVCCGFVGMGCALMVSEEVGGSFVGISFVLVPSDGEDRMDGLDDGDFGFVCEIGVGTEGNNGDREHGE
jgi:hypothetical protein